MAEQSIAHGAGKGTSTTYVPTISKELVTAALARDASFGYGRVRGVILTLMRAGAEGRPIPSVGSVLRVLLGKCADARSACALAPVKIPATIAGDYDRPIARIRVIAESAPDAHFRLDNDPFNKDLATCLGHLYPCGARLIDLHAALPRRLRFLQPLPILSLRHLSLETDPPAPWFQAHLDTRNLSEFNPTGLVRMYLRVASLLEANPHVGGVFGETWYYDPALETLSPHLAYLRQLPCDFGARLVRGSANDLTIRRALLTSKRRRLAYEQRSYRPRTYFLVWQRRDLLRWARTQSSEASREAVRN